MGRAAASGPRKVDERGKASSSRSPSRLWQQGSLCAWGRRGTEESRAGQTLLSVLQIRVQMYNWPAFTGDPEQKVSPSALSRSTPTRDTPGRYRGSSCRSGLGGKAVDEGERWQSPLQRDSQ